jgi:hypothetical protein
VIEIHGVLKNTLWRKVRVEKDNHSKHGVAERIKVVDMERDTH